MITDKSYSLPRDLDYHAQSWLSGRQSATVWWSSFYDRTFIKPIVLVLIGMWVALEQYFLEKRE